MGGPGVTQSGVMDHGIGQVDKKDNRQEEYLGETGRKNREKKETRDCASFCAEGH